VSREKKKRVRSSWGGGEREEKSTLREGTFGRRAHQEVCLKQECIHFLGSSLGEGALEQRVCQKVNERKRNQKEGGDMEERVFADFWLSSGTGKKESFLGRGERIKKIIRGIDGRKVRRSGAGPFRKRGGIMGRKKEAFRTKREGWKRGGGRKTTREKSDFTLGERGGLGKKKKGRGGRGTVQN